MNRRGFFGWVGSLVSFYGVSKLLPEKEINTPKITTYAELEKIYPVKHTTPEGLDIMIQAGAITKNELRSYLNLPLTSEPWGDEIAGTSIRIKN